MNRGVLFVLTLLVALTVVISPFQRDLFVGDETKYSQVIREMRGGSLLVPTLNGEPYTHKPPLHFWVITALTNVFGLYSAWPFVLQSIVCFLLTILLARRFAREMFGDETVDLAGFLGASFYLCWGIAQTARMDASFSLLISLAVFFFFRTYRGGGNGNLYAAGLCAGIATLIKGPMALVIPIALILFEKIRLRRLPGLRRHYFGAFLLAAVIPLVWLVPALIAGGPGYAEELLGKQTVGRAVGSWVHKSPPWFYIVNFPAAFFPSFVAGFFGIIAIFARGWGQENRERLAFCLSWFLAVFVPFSLLSGKLHVYMLPATLPLALIIARFLTDNRRDWLSGLSTFGNRLLLLVMAGLFGAAPFVALQYLKPSPENVLLQNAAVRGLFWVTAAAALLAFILSFGGRGPAVERSAVALACAALVPLIYAASVLVPLANDLASSSPLVSALQKQQVPPKEIALYYSPHLWSREMPRGLAEGVRYIGAAGLEPQHGPLPTVLVTRADHAKDLGPRLALFERVDQLRMIGKDFHVYRRR